MSKENWSVNQHIVYEVAQFSICAYMATMNYPKLVVESQARNPEAWEDLSKVHDMDVLTYYMAVFSFADKYGVGQIWDADGRFIAEKLYGDKACA